MRPLLALLLLLAAPTPAAAAEPAALFPFELVSSSMEPVQDAELARLTRLDAQLAELLEPRGFTPVDTTPVQARVAFYASLQGCNGCEVALAEELGAEIAVIGWVQKVSNLILNVNLRLTDVATGQTIKAGSVDIRANTDESWSRGLRFLVNNRLFREE